MSTFKRRRQAVGKVLDELPEAVQNINRMSQGADEAFAHVGRAAEQVQKTIPAAVDGLTSTVTDVGKSVKRFLRRAGIVGAGATTVLTGAGAYNLIQKGKKERAQRRYFDQLAERNSGTMKKQAALTPQQIGKAKDVINGMLDSVIGRTVLTAVGAAGVNTLLRGLESGAQRVGERLSKKNDKAWKSFIERYPEYASNEEAREYFNVFADFNPSAIKHPIVVKEYLSRVTGLGGLGLEMMQSLTNVESRHSTAQKPTNASREFVNESIKQIVDNMKELTPRRTREIVRDAEEKIRRGYNFSNLRNQREMSEFISREYDAQVKRHEDWGTPLSPKDKQDLYQELVDMAARLSAMDASRSRTTGQETD